MFYVPTKENLNATPKIHTVRLVLRIAVILMLAISFGRWAHPDISFAQEFPSASESPDEYGALLPNVSFDRDSEPNTSLVDSLRLRSLEIELEQARLEATQTNFAHRLIPQVHLSGSIGFKDMLFFDPSYFVVSVLPKDAYRLNLSLSLSDLFDFSKHRTAELRIERLQVDITLIRLKQQESKSDLLQELTGLDALATLDSTVLALKEDVLSFNDLRFQQGKIEYDVLIRSKLDVLGMRRGIRQLNERINDLRIRLKVHQ